MISTEQQRFYWIATLDDDSIITEFNADGSENSYKELPRARVKLFGLQSSNASYMIDTKLGTFHIKDFKNNKIVNAVVPVKNQNVTICGPLMNNQTYNFYQLKSAYGDFRPGITPQGTLGYIPISKGVITQQILGWGDWKNIYGLGQRYIVTSLVLKNDLNPEPELSVGFKRAADLNLPNLDGSPFVISF